MFDSFETPWTVAYQVSLSMGFSRQEYWSGLPFPSSGDLPDPEIFLIQGSNLSFLHWQVDSLSLSHQRRPHLGNRVSIWRAGELDVGMRKTPTHFMSEVFYEI